MNEVVLLQVSAAECNISGHVQQLQHSQRRGLILWEPNCQITVSSHGQLTSHTDSRHTHTHTHCTPQYTQAVINLTLPMHINLYLHISIWMCVYAQSPDRWKKCSPKHMYTHCTTHTTEVLTALGRFCLRKLFMSPPVMSSRRINLGRIWRLTPIQRTMFWWLNLLQIHTGIFKYTSIYVIS